MGGQVVITLNKQGRDCLRSYLFIQAREIRKQAESIMVSKHILHTILFIVFDTVFISDKESTQKTFDLKDILVVFWFRCCNVAGSALLKRYFTACVRKHVC